MVIKNLNIYSLQENPRQIPQKLKDRSHILEQAENDVSTSSSSTLPSSSSTSSSEPLKRKSTSEKRTTNAPKLVSRSENGHSKQTPKVTKSLVQKRRLNALSTRNPSAKKAKRDSFESERPLVSRRPFKDSLVCLCTIAFIACLYCSWS